MKHSYFTPPERLEQRIAPAGFVVASFTNGLLHITGFDEADHDVNIVKTGLNTFRVDGIATGINDVAHTSESFHGALKSVFIEGGSGSDTFTLTNLGPLKSLRFDGNAGTDSLGLANLVTTTGGTVDINLGAAGSSVNFFAGRTTIHGPLNIDLGGGGTAGFRSTTTTIDGDVAITGGLGDNSFAISGDTTLFRHKLTFTGGAGDNSFAATGKSLHVQGLVTMDGGASPSVFLIAANRNQFGNSLTPGLVDLELGAGSGSVTFQGKSTVVLGDLKIGLGSGGGTAELDSAVTSILGNLQVAGAAGNDTLEFDGRTSIGKSLSFVGGVGDEVLTAAGGLLAVKGPTSMVGGSGTNTFDLQVTSLALAALSVTGGPLNDTVSIIAAGTISGNTNLQLGPDGAGPSSTTLQSRAGLVNGLVFGGTLTIDMPGATVDFLTIANIQIAKAFVAQTGDDVSTVNITQVNAKSDFNLQTGVGADVVNIANIHARDFSVNTGDGADVVNIDNFHVRNFSVDTGIGADELRIERIAADTGGSQISGVATIVTGIGADEIRIGNNVDSANMKVSFMGAMSLDAGDGANLINDILGSNFFAFVPTILATGGTLTQTEAN